MCRQIEITQKPKHRRLHLSRLARIEFCVLLRRAIFQGLQRHRHQAEHLSEPESGKYLPNQKRQSNPIEFIYQGEQNLVSRRCGRIQLPKQSGKRGFRPTLQVVEML
jgi:hypothetical protein